MAKLRKKQEETDYGRMMIDEQLQELEARLTAMYGQATREMVANLEKGLAEFADEDKKKRDDLESGLITEDEYADWRMKHIYRTNQMKVQIEDLTQTLVNADVEAMKIINDKTPEFYASSYNFAGFKAEMEAQDIGINYDTFKIYNKDAIKYILKEDPDLLPQGSVDIPEDERWNRQHISNEIAQGILQGDSIPKIADRLQSVTNMDRNAAIRNARTATTGAENKGRKDAVARVREAGIPQEEWWIATHDGRTRESHILLDGQKPDEKGIYANGCAYPGDPAGDPEEIYNCRCSIGSGIPGVDHSKDSELYAKFMEENYFEDWLKVKEQREEKEAQFQEKRAGAAERVEAKREPTQATTAITHVDAKKLPEEQQKALHAYTDGRYKDICEYSQYIESKESFKHVEFWEKHNLNQISEEDKKVSEELLETIKSSEISDEVLYRFDRTPWEEGTETIDIGLRSASKDNIFDDAISGKIEGLEAPDEKDYPNDGLYTEYIILSSRGIDVSDISAYPDQREVIIAGKYRVVQTEVVESQMPVAWKPICEVYPEAEHFISKSGKDMYRYEEGGVVKTVTEDAYYHKTVMVRQEKIYGRTRVWLEAI